MNKENFLKRKMKRNNLFNKPSNGGSFKKPNKNFTKFEGKSYEKLSQVEILYRKARTLYEQKVSKFNF
jgi:hypothetical protein